MTKKLEVNIGDRYGKLSIVEELDHKGYVRIFLCKCECGNYSKVFLNNLRSGKTKSCGCIYGIHRMSKSRIYKIRSGIKRRCRYAKDSSYSLYGGRGIKYCEKRETFQGFYDDMGESYDKHFKENNGDTSIERLNNQLDYSKENCIWATSSVQARNRRSNITYKGKCIADRCKELGHKRSKVYMRIRVLGWSIEKSLGLE